ncbi:MAG: hypothetical protein ABSH22_17920 [Tepidisphaeraceae bacterium]
MKRSPMVMAAVMAVTGCGLAAQAAQPAATSGSAASTLAPTITLGPSSATFGSVIGKLTDDAMTRDNLHALVADFPAADMRRIMNSSDYSHDFGAKLDDRITGIRKTWKLKYGHDFNALKFSDALGAPLIAVEKPGPNADHETIEINAAQGQKELNLPIVRDMGMWNVQIPHSLTADRIRDNLLAELTAFDDHSAHWPAHEMDAYRLAARHVLAAVLDEPAAVSQTPAKTSASFATASAKTSAQTQPSAKSAQASAAPQRHWWEFWHW